MLCKVKIHIVFMEVVYMYPKTCFFKFLHKTIDLLKTYICAIKACNIHELSSFGHSFDKIVCIF